MAIITSDYLSKVKFHSLLILVLLGIDLAILRFIRPRIWLSFLDLE